MQVAEQADQLAKLITERVLAAVAQLQPRAQVRPPAGLCTAGDSKPAAAAADEAPALTGIVTAIRLKSHTGPIRLAPGARLTPAAVDYIREKKLSVQSVTPGTAVAAATKPAGPMAWWIGGSCPVVEKVAPSFGGQLTPLPHRRDPGTIAEAIRELAQRVKSGRAPGGVLFVSSAAVAACLANRCPALRAVVGTCEASVEAGIRQLAANVLIIEYPQHGPRSMHAMIHRFLTEPRPALPEIDRQIQELATCV